MVKINIKRFGAFVILLILASFAAWHGINYIMKSGETKNPYVSTASIVKIPDVIHYANQKETGMVIDSYAGTVSTLYTWKLNATYSGSSIGITKVIVSNSTTITYEINAISSTRWTISYITIGPNGNTVKAVTASTFIPQFNVLGQYPYKPHVIGLVKNTPVVIIFNPNQTTIVLNKPDVVPYVFVESYTSTISAVKHVFITSVSGVYTISSANYTTEILR